jgi:hypothetical protein
MFKLLIYMIGLPGMESKKCVLTGTLENEGNGGESGQAGGDPPTLRARHQTRCHLLFGFYLEFIS